ncbi:MAG: alanine racemase [Candidatus Magasanikbacteria bacterium]|nr:alanine racemase [Candidatus Magasanikbacteria bacterium]
MLTWVEIDQTALQKNIAVFRKLIGDNVQFMPVIKANAYGHGFLEIAKLTVKNKAVDRLCVVSLEEALILIQNKLTKKPILILDIFDLDIKKISVAAQYNVAFPVFTLEQAKVLNKVGERAGKKIKVHVKIDTGTSRVGFLPMDVVPFVKKIKHFPHLKLEGSWSHFSSSESSPSVTKEQWRCFNEVNTKLRQARITIPFRHISCSAATILYPEMRADGVRVGLACYGLHPAPITKKYIALTPVLSWRTKIIQVKTISKDTPVGYGGSFITKRPTRLAIIPIGYADGYDRSFSNRAFVMVNGRRCPVRGRICMNLTMIDVTGVKGTKAGDTVTLIGREGSKEITADELGGYAGTINYEIVTRIAPHIKRIVV